MNRLLGWIGLGCLGLGGCVGTETVGGTPGEDGMADGASDGVGDDDDDDDDASDELCTREGPEVDGFFTADLGELPRDNLDWDPLLDAPCSVVGVASASGQVATELECSFPDELDEVVALSTPLPDGATPAWQQGDEVRLSVSLAEAPDTIYMFDISLSLRRPDGGLLFAGSGDLLDDDGFPGLPAGAPHPAVVAPLSVEIDATACGVIGEDEDDGAPIGMTYTLADASVSLLGPGTAELESDGQRYIILQQRAELASTGHTSYGLQFSVVALN